MELVHAGNVKSKFNGGHFCRHILVFCWPVVAGSLPGTLAFLDCDWYGQSTRWTKFRKDMERHFAQNHPLSNKILFADANSIVETWRTTATKFMVNWEHFFQSDAEGLKEDPEKFYDQWTGDEDNELGNEGFCLYGFVSALYLRARFYHSMCAEATKTLPTFRMDAAWEDVLKMQQARDDLKKAAIDDYELAFLFLGKQLSADFLESSAWPVRSWMLELNLWSLLRNGNACTHPVDAFPQVLDAGIGASNPTIAVSSLGPNFDTMDLPWPQLDTPLCHPKIQIVVLSTHATFALDMATMVQAALLDEIDFLLQIHGVASRQTCALVKQIFAHVKRHLLRLGAGSSPTASVILRNP